MINQRNVRPIRRFGPVLASIAIVVAACSNSPASEETSAEETDAELTETSTASNEGAEESGAAPASEDADLELITIEAGDGPTTSYVSSAMGGVRFEIPESNTLLVSGDTLLITNAADMGNDDGYALASVGLTSMMVGGSAVESVDAYLDAVEAAGVEVTPTGTKIEVLGVELVGYEMAGDWDLAIFATDRLGAPTQSVFGPGENSIEFLGDTPSGVLAATVSDPSGPSDAWLPILGRVLDSLELTGPGFDPSLPDGQTIEFADGGPPPPAAEGSDDVDALPPLGEPFTPVEPGRYELLNFGLPVSIDVPDGWFVQPNFPGVVVLTKPGSAGPGDRDVVFINDIRELAPIAGGPLRAGEPLSVDDIEAVLSDPPEGMLIDDVERFDLTAPNGTSTPVISFGLSIDPSASCSPTEPCDFAFITSYGFVKQLLSTSDQRVWFFPEHPTGPAAVIAQGDLNSDFFAEADALMGTLELSR